MHFNELFPVRNFIIFVKKRVFRFSKFLLKHEFASHIYFTGDYDIKKIVLRMKQFRMLVNVRIKFTNLFFYFVHEAVILCFFGFLETS